MLFDAVLLAQASQMPANDTLWLLLAIGGGFLLFVAWSAVFLVPILVWRQVRRRGQKYVPGLRAYLRELPMTEEEKLDAVELTLKGVAICVLGLLFPPLVLIGLVPLYYGGRKLASVILGIEGTGSRPLNERTRNQAPFMWRRSPWNAVIPSPTAKSWMRFGLSEQATYKHTRRLSRDFRGRS